jgi:hypothetical protein
MVAGIKDCVERGLFEADFYHPDEPTELNDVNKYDALFNVAFNEHLDLPEEYVKTAQEQDIPIIEWNCDASWRFHNFVLPRRGRIDWHITTHSATLPWYEENKLKVIKSQWGGVASRKLDLPKKYDISFIGQKHGQMPDGRFIRAEIITALNNAGFNVHLFGNYWEGFDNWHGYVKDHEETVRIFNESKINLNLSYAWQWNSAPQIKGRNMQIPECGGFQLTTPADDLQSYFQLDKEMVVADSVESLVSKCRYYLENDIERQQIADAGYDRFMRDHQWYMRFSHIFEEVGLI